MNGRLVVVSNRLPLTLKRAAGGWKAEPSAGGLATALAPVLRRSGGIWIGWPGEGPGQPDPAGDELLRQWERERGFAAVRLREELGRRFYHGYANQALWPLFHQFPGRMAYDPGGWPAYVEANQRFRDAVVERLLPGDRVWVHDYHLMLLPRLLREAAPGLAIGFFLHIPFPPSDLFLILPRREELLRGLLGADLIGFQTQGHVQDFRQSVQRVLGLAPQMDRVVTEGRTVRVEARPISIAPRALTDVLARKAGRDALERLRQRFTGQRLLLAVDRLDYTKGIPERLRAFHRLLQGSPELAGKITLVQVAVPSREKIGRYRELRAEVAALLGETNGSFSTPEWTPVVYMQRAVPRPELAALYAAADLAWVSPLRDGMNLVAKEYVACQAGGAGVLVLSEFAGAAAEMGEAVLVNPYDEEHTAAAVRQALAMPEEQRRERMGALHARLLRNDVFAWADRFLELLGTAAAGRASGRVGVPPELPREQVAEAFRPARAPLVLLDYDGTLVPFARRPADALPPPGLVPLVARLARGAGRVAIVSGRPRDFLERAFDGSDTVWLAAEHGALVRPAGSRDWQPLRESGPLPGWKERVRPLLERFVDRTPGSFVEEKEYALVWHFRMAEPDFGEWLANELFHDLDLALAQTELHALRGHKVVEVKPVWASKRAVVQRLEAAGEPPDFRLAIGDDRTDEELFAALPAEAWTVHVGPGSSQARYCLDGPEDVRRLLESLVARP